MYVQLREVVYFAGLSPVVRYSVLSKHADFTIVFAIWLGLGSFGGQETYEELVEAVRIEIHLYFDLSQVALWFIVVAPGQGVAVAYAPIQVHVHIAGFGFGDERWFQPCG